MGWSERWPPSSRETRRRETCIAGVCPSEKHWRPEASDSFSFLPRKRPRNTICRQTMGGQPCPSLSMLPPRPEIRAETCCACSSIPRSTGYAVILVPRNVWQHVEGGSPPAAARRLTIASTRRRSSSRPVRRPPGPRSGSSEPAGVDVGVDGPSPGGGPGRRASRPGAQDGGPRDRASSA